jgi:hypothetical protein
MHLGNSQSFSTALTHNHRIGDLMAKNAGDDIATTS